MTTILCKSVPAHVSTSSNSSIPAGPETSRNSELERPVESMESDAEDVQVYKNRRFAACGVAHTEKTGTCDLGSPDGHFDEVKQVKRNKWIPQNDSGELWEAEEFEYSGSETEYDISTEIFCGCSECQQRGEVGSCDKKGVIDDELIFWSDSDEEDSDSKPVGYDKLRHPIEPDVDPDAVEKLWTSRNLIRKPKSLIHQTMDDLLSQQERSSVSPSMSLQGKGFDNYGNTCFMSAALQCLIRLKYFVKEVGRLKPTDRSLTPAAFSVQRIMQDVCRSYYDPRFSKNGLCSPEERLANRLPRLNRDFIRGEQCDAMEFIQFLLESMQNSSGYEGLPESLFGGVLREQRMCVLCGFTKYLKQPFVNLSVPIANSRTAVDAIRNYFAEEVVDGQVVCDHCSQPSRVSKCSSLFETPAVLILQLNRFKLGDGFIPEKESKFIPYPRQLDLSDVAHACGSGIEYELTSFLVHSGSCENGHYLAYVKDCEGKWYEKDDEHSTEVQEPFAMFKQAYVLFYSRKSEAQMEFEDEEKVRKIEEAERRVRLQRHLSDLDREQERLRDMVSGDGVTSGKYRRGSHYSEDKVR